MGEAVVILLEARSSGRVFVISAPCDPKERPTSEARFTGRVCWILLSYGRGGDPIAVDTTASRFTGASVAGLVVGAMGVFVFALYLRRWLKEQRAREEAAASST